MLHFRLTSYASATDTYRRRRHVFGLIVSACVRECVRGGMQTLRTNRRIFIKLWLMMSFNFRRQMNWLGFEGRGASNVKKLGTHVIILNDLKYHNQIWARKRVWCENDTFAWASKYHLIFYCYCVSVCILSFLFCYHLVKLVVYKQTTVTVSVDATVYGHLGDRPTRRQMTGRQVNWATTNWATRFGQLGDINRHEWTIVYIQLITILINSQLLCPQ